MRRMIECGMCGITKPHAAHGMCDPCYKKHSSPRVECSVCGIVDAHKAHGMCQRCYNIEYKSNVFGSRRMYENKSCSAFLGVHVAETILASIFNNVDRMEYGHPGYDFICSNGYKIDVKSACIRRGWWLEFNTHHNTDADFFLCIAFDDRESLTPTRLWLIPSADVSAVGTVCISTHNLEKWKKYEKSIDSTHELCENMKNRSEATK